jgi:hypothetical protein
VITGGSDYHGEIKPMSTLGSSWIEEEEFNKLLAAIALRAEKDLK